MIRTLLAFGLCLLAGAGLASAVVNDIDTLFSVDAVDKANAQIQRIKETSRLDFTVETLPQAPLDVQRSPGPERDAAFVTWTTRRAKEQKINGVYVLICREPRHMQIYVSDSAKSRFSNRDRDGLGKIMLDQLKVEKYDDALLNGTLFVQQKLGAKTAAAARSSSPAPIMAPPQRNAPATRINMGAWICLGVGLLIAVFVIIAMVRAFSRPRMPYGGFPGQQFPGNYPPPGYGQQPPQGGSMLGNVLGGVAGYMIADKLFGGSSHPQQGGSPGGDAGAGFGGGSAGGGGSFDAAPPPSPSDFNVEAPDSFDSGGSDFGSSDSGGGDSGGGGDF